ncbi:hypothetical protein [Methanopyrus sp. KOL6]|uniref:hypothetical protein n=1 Tax=Methanopyrus sp. KOL6 TaxID=1937004 RepID=UPI0012F9E175|nr:hypothetical protein [Methanopyrus sp. KOL6]
MTAHRDDVEIAVSNAVYRERERSDFPQFWTRYETSLEELCEATKTLSMDGSSGTLARHCYGTQLRSPKTCSVRAVSAGCDLWVPKGRLGVAALEVTEVTLPDGVPSYVATDNRQTFFTSRRR